MISFRSVRSRLLLAAIVVEGVMLTLLVSNSLRLTNYFMVEQLEQQHQQMTPVLTAATVAPLAQRDYATVQSVLNESLSKQGVRYLAVVDAAGSRVAAIATLLGALVAARFLPAHADTDAPTSSSAPSSNLYA